MLSQAPTAPVLTGPAAHKAPPTTTYSASGLRIPLPRPQPVTAPKPKPSPPPILYTRPATTGATAGSTTSGSASVAALVQQPTAQLPQPATASSSEGRTVVVTHGQLTRPSQPEQRQQVYIDNAGNRRPVAPTGSSVQYATAPAVYMTAPVPIQASSAHIPPSGQPRPQVPMLQLPATPQQSAAAKRPPPPLPPELLAANADQHHHDPTDQGPTHPSQSRPSGFAQR